MDKKIILKESASVMELAPILVDKVGLDKSRAGAVINAFARSWRDDLRFVGPLAEATQTTEGRKRILSLKNVGPKSLGYIMRALEFVDIEYDNTASEYCNADINTTEELLKKTKPRYSGIGRVTLYFSKEVAGNDTHEVESQYLMWVGEERISSRMILDGSEMTRPGLMVFDDDEMLPGFIRITDEFGYSRLFKKELLESMDIEMFDIEKPDDLE